MADNLKSMAEKARQLRAEFRSHGRQLKRTNNVQTEILIEVFKSDLEEMNQRREKLKLEREKLKCEFQPEEQEVCDFDSLITGEN